MFFHDKTLSNVPTYGLVGVAAVVVHHISTQAHTTLIPQSLHNFSTHRMVPYGASLPTPHNSTDARRRSKLLTGHELP